MKNRREYDAALAAEYALGTLRGPARMYLERRLLHDRALASEVARWQETFCRLDASLAPVVPPERVWKKIQLRLPAEKNVVPIPPRSTASLSRFRWHYAGWAIAAGLALLLVVPRWLPSPIPLTPVAVLSGSQGQQWVVNLDKGNNRLNITPMNAQSLADNRSLQLWSIAPGGKPRSLGLVLPADVTQLTLSEALPTGATLAISIEPRGGSPTGQPTGAVLFSGQLKS
jgi:anti-sigma-K factor RskA